MIRHPFTLEHVARALDRDLRGGRIVEAWSQEKATATFVVLRNDELRTYHVDCTSGGGSITERPAFRRARANTTDVFAQALNEDIVMVTKHPDDRIITIWFPSSFLHIELFSGGRGNIVLVRDGVVRDALREKLERVGTVFTVAERTLPAPFHDPSQACGRSLAASTLLLGPHYADEVCARSAVDPAAPCGELSSAEREELLRRAQDVADECVSATTFYVLHSGDDVLLSLIPLQGWDVVRSSSEILDVLRFTLSERGRRVGFRERQRTMLRTYEQALKRVQRSIEGMTSDAAREDRSERYRHHADILMAQPEPDRRDLDAIDVEDFDGAQLTITLDPKRSIIENARALYEKSRASAAAARSRAARLPSLLDRRSSLEQVLERVRTATSLSDISDLDTIVTEEALPSRDEGNGRFRVFVLDEAHTLYVGKNAANNDELTMRFARQNDWWLHARGAAGSHAVLRGVSTEKIPKQILEKAAAITAYYSQARNASWVSVVYTQRKYVRKPKEANVGAVVLDREQTVMVKPAAPSEG